jgi:CHASE3 domain sensor protein
MARRRQEEWAGCDHYNLQEALRKIEKLEAMLVDAKQLFEYMRELTHFAGWDYHKMMEVHALVEKIEAEMKK